MSAGQAQDGSFQLCIWEGRTVIKHFDVVYYRDRIRVVKKRGHIMWFIVKVSFIQVRSLVQQNFTKNNAPDQGRIILNLAPFVEGMISILSDSYIFITKFTSVMSYECDNIIVLFCFEQSASSKPHYRSQFIKS